MPLVRQVAPLLIVYEIVNVVRNMCLYMQELRYDFKICIHLR